MVFKIKSTLVSEDYSKQTMTSGIYDTQVKPMNNFQTLWRVFDCCAMIRKMIRKLSDYRTEE